MLSAFGNGLVAIVNGVLVLIERVANPTLVCGVLLALGLLWMAAVEIEELDRAGLKPVVDRH